MEIRLATTQDLPALKEMYRRVVERMVQSGLEIWDDVYPVEFLKDDVAVGNLYFAEEDGRPIAAFVLSTNHASAGSIQWNLPSESVIYLDRLAVSVEYSRQGVGKQMLSAAAALAKEKGYTALRLFVVDNNLPALRLYQRAGFQQAEGCLVEVFEDGFTLREFGFEIAVSDLCGWEMAECKPF